jgi:hypothetical protein
MKINDSCAPSIDTASTYTCFSKRELFEIAAAFNIFIQSHNICNSVTKACVPRTLIQLNGQTKKQLWQSIYDRLKVLCGNESCWTELKFIESIPDKYVRDRILYFTFKPKMTKSQYAWLSTEDINAVLQQYHYFNDSFKFFGALPSDFHTLMKFDYKEFTQYKMCAIVFNLDKHNESGSHWVAFVVDNLHQTIEYFDSIGNPPNKCIKQFIKNVHKTLKGYSLKVNTIQHQKENSECGVYAIYYIIQRLLGSDFDTLTHNVISDSNMNRFREYIFRRK